MLVRKEIHVTQGYINERDKQHNKIEVKISNNFENHSACDAEPVNMSLKVERQHTMLNKIVACISKKYKPRRKGLKRNVNECN